VIRLNHPEAILFPILLGVIAGANSRSSVCLLDYSAHTFTFFEDEEKEIFREGWKFNHFASIKVVPFV
jgi:hypothetical protein